MHVLNRHRRGSGKPAIKLLLLAVLLVTTLVIVCLAILHCADYNKPAIVNLQLAEYQNSSALAKVVGTMASYGIKPYTIFVSEGVVEQNCSLIRNLYDNGYEIAAFGYNVSPTGSLVPITNMPFAAQESMINSTKTAIERCTGQGPEGFSSQGFSKDNTTNKILKDLGFGWDSSFVTNFDPEASAIPYYSNSLGFYVVSIQGIIENHSVFVLCDRACQGSGKTPAQWRNLVENYFRTDQAKGVPFVTEFHPGFLVSNTVWWDNFTQILSWLRQQDATYVTTQQMINECAAPAKNSSCA